MIITAGELLVEFVSHEVGCGLSRIAKYSGPYPSGAPAIFIDQAARMGVKARIFAGVGADAFGRALLARLEGHGVDTSHVAVHEDATTGVAFVSYYPDGSRTFIFHLTGTAADRIGDCPIDDDMTGAILHVSGSSLGNKAIRDKLSNLAEQIVARGGKVCCDPNVRPELIRDPGVKAALDGILRQSAYILPSEDDLAYLYPGLDRDAAVTRLLQTGAEVVALKLGDQGAVIAVPSGRTVLTPHRAVAVDPTGAGDCFCGTFMALLSRGMEPAEAGRMANAAGALAVTRRGPMEGNSSLDEVTAFLAQQDDPQTRGVRA